MNPQLPLRFGREGRFYRSPKSVNDRRFQPKVPHSWIAAAERIRIAQTTARVISIRVLTATQDTVKGSTTRSPASNAGGVTIRDAVGNINSVLVLGGGSEIATAIVTTLRARRCRTVVLAVRSPSIISDLVASYEALGFEVHAIEFDAARTDTHGDVVHRAFTDHGDIDLVISAFAVQASQAEYDLDPAAAADAVQVNLGGQVSTLTAVAAEMKRQGHGTIVVLSSVAGERVRKENAVYGATKAGLDAFCQGLSDRLVGSGVAVMIVRPGFVHTRLTEGMEAAPFATTPDKVADDILAGLDRGAAVVWSPESSGGSSP